MICVSVCLFVCLSVCLSDRISQTSHVKISPNYLYMLHVTVARFFYDGNEIRCTSGFVDDVMFSYNTGNRPNQRRRVCFVHFARWQHRGRSLTSPTASYRCSSFFVSLNSCELETTHTRHNFTANHLRD